MFFQIHTNTVRQIIMHAMSEWYMMVENDQTRLSRILDVAQDLKALSLLLNAQSFPFVVDLACLAYRRECCHSICYIKKGRVIIYMVGKGLFSNWHQFCD